MYSDKKIKLSATVNILLMTVNLKENIVTKILCLTAQIVQTKKDCAKTAKMPNYVTASGSNSILDQLTHPRAQGIYHSGGVPDWAME